MQDILKGSFLYRMLTSFFAGSAPDGTRADIARVPVAVRRARQFESSVFMRIWRMFHRAPVRRIRPAVHLTKRIEGAYSSRRFLCACCRRRSRPLLPTTAGPVPMPPSAFFLAGGPLRQRYKPTRGLLPTHTYIACSPSFYLIATLTSVTVKGQLVHRLSPFSYAVRASCSRAL
jgi:hypothetical protein